LIERIALQALRIDAVLQHLQRLGGDLNFCFRAFAVLRTCSGRRNSTFLPGELTLATNPNLTDCSDDATNKLVQRRITVNPAYDDQKLAFNIKVDDVLAVAIEGNCVSRCRREPLAVGIQVPVRKANPTLPKRTAKNAAGLLVLVTKETPVNQRSPPPYYSR
jgi:hypothetical protein